MNLPFACVCVSIARVEGTAGNVHSGGDGRTGTEG